MECIQTGISELTQAKEQRIKGFGTLRSVANYAHEFGFSSTESFLTYLGEDVTILDAGSGLDGFAFDVVRQNLPITVYSMNPWRVDKTRGETSSLFQTIRYGAIKTDRENIFPNLSEDEIQPILDIVNNHAIAGFGHRIPLDDRSVDIILDCQAISTYSYDPKIESLEVYTLYLLEALRILNDGGRLLIQDTTLSAPRFYLDKIVILNTLAEMGYLSYTLITNQEGFLRGAEIRKLKHPVFYDRRD